MANITVTYTFANSTTADATQVNQNFTDLTNGLSDGTKDISVSAGTFAGTLTANGNVTLGNASGDDITITGSLASTIPIKTTNTYNIGSSTLGLASVYFGANSQTVRVLGSASMSATYTFTLPPAAGSAGNSLVNTGSSTTVWSNMTSPISAVNYSLAASVGSNALTISLKDASGSDASSTSPVYINFRSATAATGTVTTRAVTSALSVVVSSGSTLGHSNAKQGYIFVYAIDNAGTVELAVSGQPFTDTLSRVTTTAEGGAGAADSNVTLYSTTARTTVGAVLIGRMLSTQTTAGTWAAVPTEISCINGHMVRPRSEVYVDSGNGHGSTNTKIRRYSNIRKNVGTAITYADSAGDGGSFTINEDGIYSMHAADVKSGAVPGIGFTVNDAAMTTSIFSMTYANGVRSLGSSASSEAAHTSWTGFLVVGDIVRLHTTGGETSTGYDSHVSIVKVSD